MTSIFERIQQAEGLNAAVAYDRDVIARQLDQIDAQSTLSGMSVGVKDNICTLEYPTTCF